MIVHENYSLKSLNTFGLDAKARWFTSFQNKEELTEILNDSRFKGVDKLVLGGGSNILLTKDFHGLVLQNKIMGTAIVSEDNDFMIVEGGAGMNWHEFVLYTISKNSGGLENLSLIPGNIGAAPIQNIGAYGVEIKNTFHDLTALNIQTGKIEKFNIQQCMFGYRDSFFKRDGKNRYVIIAVSFRLNKNPAVNTSYGAINDQLKKMDVTNPGIKDVSNAVIAIRSAKLPDPKIIGNAGSFFKNPEIPAEQFEVLKNKFTDIPSFPAAHNKIKVPAGWLIEQCGWKGKRVGNTGMHKDQALVLVNYGNATGEELIVHATRVQKSVAEKFGIVLEMEVNIL